MRESASSVASRSADARSPARLVPHMTLAAMGLLIFLALMMTSGRVDAGGGLGWDGQGYASLMTDGLDQGSVITRSRPLMPLLTRIPHHLGLDVIPSFQLMNVIYAFTLYLFIALILDRAGAGMRDKAVVIGNLALCISTSKLYAYYPVLIDLGALALITAAFYFVMTDRHWLGGMLSVLAMPAREFGVVLLFCAVHRAFRRGRLWPDALWYLPGAGMAVVVRTMTSSEGSLSLSDATANLQFWLSPIFVAAFAYFAITVFGGISALLALHPRWCFARLREEPELATFLVVIVGLALVGNLDIWRYLAFALPVAVVLVGQYFRDRVRDPAFGRSIVAMMTFITVITQRPFEQMDRTTFFRDWLPLYILLDQPPLDLLALWATRLMALGLLLVALVSIGRSNPGLRDSVS
jgi:hypothetical protein